MCVGGNMGKFENVYYILGETELNLNNFFKDIFSEKEDTESESTNSNTAMPLTIDVLDIDNTNKDFTFKFKGMDYSCSYLYKSLDSEKRVFKVNIILNYLSRKEQAAYAFSELIQTIKTKKKNDFNMTVIKDSLSTYYSERLYSKLALYERSMRALITSIFIPIHKDSWADALQDSLGKEIKGNKKQLLEGALEELDLFDLESIFFDRILSINVENYEKSFQIDNIESLSKEELVEMIKLNRPISLWEKEIARYAFIDDAQIRMRKIRDLRNKIAHNKNFTRKNFNNLKKELDYIIPKLNEAENKILNARDISTLNETLELVAEKFAALGTKLYLPYLKEIERIGTYIKQAIPKEFTNMVNHISTVYSPKFYFEDKKVEWDDDND